MEALQSRLALPTRTHLMVAELLKGEKFCHLVSQFQGQVERGV